MKCKHKITQEVPGKNAQGKPVVKKVTSVCGGSLESISQLGRTVRYRCLACGHRSQQDLSE